MIKDQEITLSTNLPSKYNDKEIKVIYETIDHKKPNDEDNYLECKFGPFKCVYCTHGGCSKK